VNTIDNSRMCRREGRTTREIVVAAVVVLVLALLLAPYLLQQRATSRRNFCELRQIELARAVTRFEVEQGYYPGYRSAIFSAGRFPDDSGDQEASPPIGWVYSLLPYLELPAAQQANEPTSFRQLFLQHGPSGPDDLRGRVPQEEFFGNLLCPTDPRSDGPRDRAICSFVANAGMPDAEPTEEGPLDWPANGVFLDAFTPPLFPVTPLSRAQLNEGDGSEHTLLLSENLDSGLWIDHEESRVGLLWVPHLVDGQPDPGDQLLRINEQGGKGDGSIRFARPSSFHPGGVNVVFASQRSQFLSQDIDYVVYAHLMTTDITSVTLPGSQAPAPAPYRSDRFVESDEP
jgi:hypothetical protein